MSSPSALTGLPYARILGYPIHLWTAGDTEAKSHSVGLSQSLAGDPGLLPPKLLAHPLSLETH